MYQIAICDHEISLAMHTKHLVSQVLLDAYIPFQIQVFSDPLALLALLDKEPNLFHLLILEVSMKQKSGLSLAMHLRKGNNNVSILFTAPNKSFSLECYNAFPIHYLIKPIKKESLSVALKSDYANKVKKKRILVKEKHGSRILYLSSILYIESCNRKIAIHLENESLSYLGSLRELQAKLPKGLFVRCHRSFLVSRYGIKYISKQKIHLINGEELPIGGAYYDVLYKELIDYLE